MISQAIQNLRPGSQFNVIGGDDMQVSRIEWLDDNTTAPTDAEIAAEVFRLEAEQAANAYKAQRAAEYPAIGDQLDALFHAGVFPPEMAAMIQAVKDKYPKGGN